MNRLFRRLVPVIGMLALWPGTVHAIIFEVPAPSTSVDISNCIGNCPLFPFVPAMSLDLSDVGGMLSVMGGSTAMGTRAADNGTDGDSTAGTGESTYGGALGALANAMSSSPLPAGAAIAATSSTAVWIGEYTVSGFGAVLLDMSVTVDGTLFAGAMSSGAAQMDVTVGIITVSELQIAIDGLNVATILDFLSGNVYVGGATLEADGSSPPVATPDGAATAADLDTTACTTAAVDCTVEVSISTISLGTGLSVAAGENVLVLAGLGVFAGLDLNTAGYLSADFLNTMTVQLTTDTPGASVELVSISIREPATLWLSVIALFGLAIGKSHRRRIRQFGGQ